LQHYFDAGWERETRPMMGKGRVMQEAPFHGFSPADTVRRRTPF
jgi:hypothetical protein